MIPTISIHPPVLSNVVATSYVGLQVKIQVLRHTDRISSTQQPQVASGRHTGQCRARLWAQKVPLEVTISSLTSGEDILKKGGGTPKPPAHVVTSVTKPCPTLSQVPFCPRTQQDHRRTTPDRVPTL